MVMPKTPVSTNLTVIKEPFPNFGSYINTAFRDLRAASKGVQEVEQRLVTHNFMKWSYNPSNLPVPRYSVQQWAASGKKVPYSEYKVNEESKYVTSKKKWQLEQDTLLAEHKEAIRILGSASWMDDFYKTAPELVNIGAVSTFEDYLTLMKSDPAGIVPQEQQEVAKGVLTQLVANRTVIPEETTTMKGIPSYEEGTPDWLKVTPEEEEAARKFLSLDVPSPVPITIHQLSTAEIVKALTANRVDVPLPEGMSDKELLAIAAVLDIPVEAVTTAVDYTELLKPYSDAIAEREEKIRAVLAGTEDWKMPELGFWENIAFTITSPMQVAADAIKPYLEHFAYPWAGFVAYSVSRFLHGTQDIEDEYAKMKSKGYNWWDAMGEAYQEWGLPWYLKLSLEMVTDPLTYTPGLLLKAPGTILTKIPTAATRMLGGGLLSLNKGLWYATDLPFDAAKSLWARLPKTFNQATKLELDRFRDSLMTSASTQSGHIVNMLTVDDLTRILERAMKDFKATPKKQGDVFVDLGKALYRHAPLGSKDIEIWSRSLGGKLDTVTEEVVKSVEDIVSDSILKIGSPAENAKRLAIAMGIEDTPTVIGKLIKDIGVLTNKYTSRVSRAIEIGKNAKISPVLQMTEYLVSGQKKIIAAVERSEYAKGKVMSGIVLGLMNSVDKLERGVFRQTLDRWLVRPAAESYLGSIAYPLWNAFEGIFVNAMEGVVPQQVKQEAFQRMFLGVRGVDSRVVQWSASDVAGILRTIPGREDSISLFSAMAGKPGTISYLPGKVPEKVLGLKTPKWIAGKDWFEWTGKKWIGLSDTWGTALRANFLMKKMANYLAEYSYEVAGHDLNVAFNKLVKRSYPTSAVAKKSLGLTDHALKQEMFARVTTGLKSEVLGMKDMVSNSNLMRGEAMKILRQATEISPQAKTLGEQMIARGESLRTTEDIMDFCKILADQSVADLRAYPAAAPDSFRFMADQIEAQAIGTPDDLMQIFQHYEVMSDSASRVPMRLLSQVMEESDELKRLGKFGQLETLWRTSRADVETITDSISESLNRAKAVIQGKSILLKPKEQIALNALLERNTNRITLQTQFLKFDGRLLDDFWKLPKAMRTAEAHTELRAYRLENILKYKGEDAVLGAGDFLERQSYAQLYKSLPKPKFIRVDASTRALSADDCAKVMGANVDALTTGLMESMTFQDKPYFIQMIKQSADANPTHFKGFTEEKIGQVYDGIIKGLRMSPEMDIAAQKILQQVEGVKQKMIALKMTHSLSPSEEKALNSWVDDVVAGMDDIIAPKVKKQTMPDYDIGLGERLLKEGSPETESQLTYYMEAMQVSREQALREVTLDRGVPIMVDYNIVDRIRGELTEAAKKVEVVIPDRLRAGTGKNIGTLKDIYDEWFANSSNTALQIIGDTAEHDPEYLATVRGILHKKYANGFDAAGRRAPELDKVRLYRGEGQARGKYLDRKYTNVTSSRKTALDFEDTWNVSFSPAEMEELDRLADVIGLSPEDAIARIRAKRAEVIHPSVDNVLVKVDDIVSIGSVDESELIIPAAVLRDRIANPLPTPTIEVQVPAGKGMVTKSQWDEIRQKASESAHKDYYKAFADYTNENLIDAMGKMIYPYWSYHMYRWFFLPRTFLRKPGTMAAWGKYNEYSDQGYQHIPGTDLEFSPAVGSAFGTTFGLARHDFKSYYENLGFMGEVLDFTQRRGFFPGIHITLPVALSSIFSGRPPELGETLPAVYNIGLNLLVTSKIPGVSSAAIWLKDRVFHQNFHDYYTSTIISSKQVESGGKLIDGQSGVDLWFKQLRGESLTEDEQKLWDEAYNEAAWYGILRSEFPELRVKAEEQLEAYKQVTALIEAQTGMDADYQDNLWKHNLRPTDQIGGLPLDLQMALDQMWQWRIYFGRGAILMAPEYSNLSALTDKYYGKVEGYQLERLSSQTNSNKGFLYPSKEVHFNGGEWRREYASNWSTYTDRVDTLDSDPEYADAIDAMTPEGQIRLAKERGFTVPPTDPMKEAIRLYFDIELEKKVDPYTGEEEDDFLGFWVKREAIRQALPEEQRADFDTYIRRYQTPMEVLFKQVTNDYFRGYSAVSRIVLTGFSEDEKALIAEFYADTTSRERKLEIQSFTTHTGRTLISDWDSQRTDARAALRYASPKLDFWLYVFGYIDSPKTDEAKAMIDAWEKDKSSIIRGITETPLLGVKIVKAEAKEAKDVK